MYISLDFFEDVFVPGHSLPEGAAYHEVLSFSYERLKTTLD